MNQLVAVNISAFLSINGSCSVNDIEKSDSILYTLYLLPSEMVSAKMRSHRVLDEGVHMDYIKRTLEKKILEIKEDYSCLLLIGPRQVGKTTIFSRSHLVPENSKMSQRELPWIAANRASYFTV